MTESGDGTAFENPPTAECIHRIEDGLDGGDLVTLVGQCTVTYDGRTTREFDLADRYILCKPDGTVLVHEATGLQPVAYGSPGAHVEASADDARADDHAVVRAERDDPPESLEVAFESIDLLAVTPVSEADRVDSSGAEARLRARLLDEPALLEPGFQPLATERETQAGPIDVFGRDSRGRTVVVEVKASRVGPDAVGQLARYVEAVQRDLHAGTQVRGVLLAPAVTPRARRLLAEHGLEFVPVADE